MVCRTAPFLMTLNDPYSKFQGYAILWLWISQKRYDIQASFNDILIATCTRPTQQCHFEWPLVTLSDLAKYSMTRSVARSLGDSWASCCSDNVNKGVCDSDPLHVYRVVQIKIPHRTKCDFSTTVWDFYTQISWFILERSCYNSEVFKKLF